MAQAQSITSTLATYDAVHAAIQHHAPLSIIYATGGEIVRERVIRPERIIVGPRGSDLIIATDSLREGVVSFRVDRVIAVSGAITERM
jgi:predicted DNA-binding transcriptional regulator YafY